MEQNERKSFVLRCALLCLLSLAADIGLICLSALGGDPAAILLPPVSPYPGPGDPPFLRSQMGPLGLR